ncbi:hypothetical protein AOCH_000897 [Aspergillus ochraceoroseus]|uniref:Fatty acid synthase subunit alpha n=2 Tax=Aspergillus ochraceoroseus TaxID=138278 RepID=A0A0F8V9G9_9EURO|nr:hypothetical protein AOCH_000897 [Aspergillus ochraceoroseus]
MTLRISTDSPLPVEGDEAKRKELALTVFIELLSYQLASPVRWIETQSEMFGNELSIQRFIEVGPRTTLATMAKKSAAIRYKLQAPSQWSHLQFLSYNDDLSTILYQPSESVPQAAEVDSPSPKAPVEPHPRRQPNPAQKTATAQQVPNVDSSLLARHIVLAIVAQKLRRPFDQVPAEKSIRDLSGGKSTLQNELTGDLMSEFGRIPEGVEDLPLSALGEALQSGFAGMPAKYMASLISRLISSTMPAGFNQSAIQAYLGTRWGLTKPHAIIPLCFATTMPPENRLPDVQHAEDYLDSLVNRYAAYECISWESRLCEPGDNDGLHTPVMVDTASLDALRRDQSSLYRAQFSALAKYLKIREPGSDEEPSESQVKVHELEKMLGQWTVEFDDQFLQGVGSIFSAIQARHYDSWWNWSREELIRWLNEIFHTGVHPVCTEDRMKSILNRWESTCTDIVNEWLSHQLPRQQRTVIHSIQELLDEIATFSNRAQVADPLFVYTLAPLGPRTGISSSGQLEYQEVPRNNRYYPYVVRRGLHCPQDAKVKIPFVHIKTRQDNEDWQYDIKYTNVFHAMLDIGATTGLTYAGKTALVTGAGPDSIASHIVRGLLSGGARVVITTSRAISESAGFYQQMYRQHGARGSSLTILPMNQASRQDCELLVRHIYGPGSPCGGDLDYIIPFAAIPQTGEPEALGGRQELALRAMLVNVLRLIGYVHREKQALRIETRPTMVVLPMSCNEGTFGGDGLYAESKIGLRSLFNRFCSESWSTYMTVCGAVIGWTRGTAIMRSSNLVAEEMEKLGMITFTQAEMAFNILALMTPAMTALAEEAPIYADLTGGAASMWNIKKQISAARKRVSHKLQLRTLIAEEDARQQMVIRGPTIASKNSSTRGKVRLANLSLKFPILSDIDESLPNIRGMVDLSRVVVVVGYSELGPWGNARTRWEMEHQAKFSLEGYMEMAWMMGLIKHVDGQLNGQPYVGWVDVKTETPVRDDEVPEKYHKHIMAHTGLRLIEPSNEDKYDPSRKEFLHEVAVEEDLPPFEASKASAEAFKLRHGAHVSLQKAPDSENYRVYLKKGAVLMVPKTVPFHQMVAGRIPQGWDALRYGIPEDIVQQVDITTLYALCCVSEAFLSAGIRDPYEIYEYIHVSELANCLGTGGGPLKVIQSMYRDRFLDRQVRGDIILEHFLNTMGAWVNMLLLSATGPLKTPVGACATALESLDMGCEAIKGGKCKIAVVGGCDDYREELAYEFANIKATANSAEELAKGRTPAEISRPTASSRNGFAESAGCGVQILTTAELAIEMGLPIHGVVAYTQMASDQVGRSIPAPGKGILTAARETSEGKNSPFLNLDLRRARFDEEIQNITPRGYTHGLSQNLGTTNGTADPPTSDEDHLLKLKVHDAQRRWANDLHISDPSISPIRAALATWGLTIDDIKAVSMHGTSTKANEINEGEVIHTQMEHLGRRKGNPLFSVCQKSLTGHPKAAAGAWQLNGCLQMMQECIIPGNRNADNIDSDLRQFEHLVYPMESIRVGEVKATMLTSFGFGQKGAINIMVSPKYLFASIPLATFQRYRSQVTKRQRSVTPVFISRVMRNCLVQVKAHAPWSSPEAMQQFLLNPTSRIRKGKISCSNPAPKTGYFLSESEKTLLEKASYDSPSMSSAVQAMLETLTYQPCAPTSTLGVDIEDIANINMDNATFINRNFTAAERKYCFKAPNPRASFAGRWSAKEAVFKSLQTPSVGSGAAMGEIEIINVNGIPRALLHGHAQEIAASQGIRRIEITISHCDETAIAMALAIRRR